MATTKVILRGKAVYAMVRENQKDTAFADYDEPRTKGGNWSIRLDLDDENFKIYNALGLSMVRPKGQQVKLTRYEWMFDKDGVRKDLGPPVVTGVDADVLIGNGSDVACLLEVFDYEFKKRPGRAARLISIEVENLVPYEPKVDNSEAVPF